MPLSVAKDATRANNVATLVAKNATPVAEVATLVAKVATPVAEVATDEAEVATLVAEGATPVATNLADVAGFATDKRGYSLTEAKEKRTDRMNNANGGVKSADCSPPDVCREIRMWGKKVCALLIMG